jgi:hypothetical protein
MGIDPLGFETLKTQGITKNCTEEKNAEEEKKKEYINILVLPCFIGKYSCSHKAEFYAVPYCARREMTGRRERRRKQLLDDLKEKIRYWKLKEEAPDRTLWRTRFGRGYGPVVRQTTE